MARISSRLTSPPTIPENTLINEKITTAGISTLRRPMRSERNPIAKADKPQNTARMPTRLPRSASSSPNSGANVGNSTGRMNRSSPTSPKVRLRIRMIFHS